LDNLVLRRLFPDKQALHLGELQRLLDADVLELIHQKEREFLAQEEDPAKVEISIVDKETR
jgi:hypothetical protein